MQRHAQVVDRARERSEVEDVVDRLVVDDRVDHVVVQERERVVTEVVDVLERRDDEVVDAEHAVAARASSVSHRCEPRKPAPPVTSEVGMVR